MARPSTPRDLSLTVLVQTKVTPGTGKRLRDKVNRKGLKVSTYVRILILNDLDKKGE